jgi:hypothetical protein
MKPRLVECSALVLLGACSPATPPSAQPGRSAPYSVASPRAASATSVGSAASPPPSTSSPAPEPAAAPPFQLVRNLGCREASLHVLPPMAFVSCGQELLVVEGDEIRAAPTYQRGIEPEEPSFLWQITGMVGTWPDAAWLGRNRSTESAAQGQLQRWTGQRWSRVADARRDEPLDALLPWTKQRAVALVQPPHVFGARFIPLGAPAFNVPRFTAPKLPHAHCRSRLRAEVQVALAPGELLVAGGQVCDVVRAQGGTDTVHSGLGVERFTADAAQGELLPLDGLPELPPHAVWVATALVAVPPSSALLAAHAVVDATHRLTFFARWDGTRFRALPPPMPGGIDRVWVETPEVLWATDLDGHLWRGRSDRWQRVAWQPPAAKETEITHVWARGPSDVWILTHSLSRNESAVFHGRAD